ncbi:MAG TPA: M23 family metallopeptidase [Gemmatimonadaceae bacterium]|nr:M23 family metallopeptidase [Gemmatimonadaceae bacterium]
MQRMTLFTGVVAAALTLEAQTKPSYQLPFPAGDSARLIQGNNGPYGHEGHAAYAFDFIMKIGSPVVAARSGIVVATEERFRDATRKPGEENFVIVHHGDSTYARYYHLTTDGAVVDVGDRIRAGDTIARSGDSGASAGAHLHFDVTRDCFRWGCTTIPVTFANASPDSLVPGRYYHARAVK